MLPSVVAEGLEAEVWRRFIGDALDLERLAEQLESAGDASEAARRYRSRLASVDEEIAKRVRQIQKWNDDIEQFDPDSVTAERAREKLPPAERELKALRQSRVTLAATAPKLLSRADVDALVAEVERVVVEAAEVGADPERQRALLRSMEVGVTVGLDAAGVLIGAKHRFWLRSTGRLVLTGSGKLSQISLPLWRNIHAA